MASTLQEADLRRVLDVVDAGGDADLPPAGFPRAVLDALAQLVPADMVSFCDFDLEQRTSYAEQDLAGGELTSSGVVAVEAGDPFFTHYWSTPACSYPSRSGDQRTITLGSDFGTRREWRATPMFTEYFAASGIPFESELMCCLPGEGTRQRRLLLFRLSGRGFDERDRLLMTLLRPHLVEMVRTLEQRRAGTPDLTPRQRELLRLVAAGFTNQQIATRLVVSAHTVRTHLENIFARLEVTSRAAAVARAFPDGLLVERARPVPDG